MTTTPVAVFTYNRPAHTRQLLESLAACHRLDECHIVIFSDGPKTPAHEQAVQSTRAVIQEWAGKRAAEVVERSENLGLARSITSGVTDLCNEYGRVIVVEDDLILHPAFIHFMLSALDRYLDDERVAQISGYMFPVRNSTKTDALFLPNSTSWGWSTWTRAWKLFDSNPKGIQDILNKESVRKRFDIGGASGHSKLLQDRLDGKNQSWAILFYWAVFRYEKLVLYPRQSLVYNAGFSGGTHYQGHGRERPQILLDTDAWPLSYKLVWPCDVTVSQDSLRKISAFFRNYHGYSLPLCKRIRALIRKQPGIVSLLSSLKAMVRKYCGDDYGR